MEANPVFVHTGKIATELDVAVGVHMLVALSTLLTNLSLLFVYRSVVHRDLSTMLVSFVCLADVLYVIYTCVLVAMPYMRVDLSDATCTAIVTVQSVLRTMPSLTFAAIGYNCYVAAFKPTSCYAFHQIRFISLKCFLAIWLVSIVANLGVPFVVCGRFHQTAFVAYSTGIITSVYILPLVLGIILHTINLLKTKNENEDPTKRQALWSYNRKITKVFLFLSTNFFVFTVPLLVYPLFVFLGFKSSYLAVVIYRTVSCIPCLMNPICQYFLSQKFQDQLRDLVCRKKSVPNVQLPVNSPGPGLFDPRQPSWKQTDEYQNREFIYGELPSLIPLNYSASVPGVCIGEDPSTKRKKTKDVRFSGIDEDILSTVMANQSTQQIVSVHAAPSTSKANPKEIEPGQSKKHPQPIAEKTQSEPIPRTASGDAAHTGTWPRYDVSPYHCRNFSAPGREYRNLSGRRTSMCESRPKVTKESRDELSGERAPNTRNWRVYKEQPVMQTDL